MQTDIRAVTEPPMVLSYIDEKCLDIGPDFKYNIGFENVSTISLKDSHDFSIMSSVDLTASLEAKSEKKKDAAPGETMIDKIVNFGTNMKYKMGGLGQKNLLENPIWMLGKEYTRLEEFIKRFRGVIWCSYRRNFPRILGKVKGINEIYTNDTGWGCMVRATQMMFAEVLQRNLRCRFKDFVALQDAIISSLIDGEDVHELAPYSIHSICHYLYESLNTKPAMHNKFRKVLAEDLEVAVFLEGTIYLDQILDKVCPEPKNEFEDISLKDYEISVEECKKDPQSNEGLDTENKTLNAAEEADDAISDTSSTESEEEANEEARAKFQAQMKSAWSRSIFFVLLAKVGLDEINSEYTPCIKELLSYPESVGMIGGRPGNAYYFVGYQNDDLIYLDPHFVQDACLTKQDIPKHKQTYFCEKPRTINISKIDTSIALGFYIENAKDFAAFMKRIQKTSKKSSCFFGLEKYSPVLDDLEDDLSWDGHQAAGKNDGDYTML